MKRLFALLVTATLLIGVLASCGNPWGKLPANLSGKDAAKILLAKERLNSQTFKNTDSIFNSGATAFADLYRIAEENLAKYGTDAVAGELLSANRIDRVSVSPAMGQSAGFDPELKQEMSDGSVLERDGNVYRWKNFSEYSNSYDYFRNITNNVKTSAEIGARLIDDTKKYIRIVDTWVDIGGTQYYLHVEGDEEIIYCREDVQQEICRRYKREDGINVYELYTGTVGGGSMRMVYIPGEKYEYSYIYGSFNHNFTAENTKGFWEVTDIGKTDWGYNVSCMVLKNDICYDAFYDPASGESGSIKVISPDKKTDILTFDYREHEGGMATVNLQAFEGVDYIELITDNVVELGQDGSAHKEYVYRYEVPSNPKQDAHVVYYPGNDNCTLVLKSGKVINSRDSFFDGKIDIHGVGGEWISTEDYTDGYTARMTLEIEGDSYDEVMNNLEEFFAHVGLRCTRDFKAVRSGILQAQNELGQMTKYHTWNESPIRSNETLSAGYENNLKKHREFADMLNAIKDAEVIDFNNRDAAELRINFAPITAQTSVSVKNDRLAVTVEGLALTVEDTTLFVVGEKYTVNFALKDNNTESAAGLTHLDSVSTASVEYQDSDSFTVTGNASFELPVLSSGEYTLVAYISTEDGIRSSGYQSVIFTELSAYSEKKGEVNIRIDKNQKGELVLFISSLSEIEVQITFTEAPSYEDMFSALEEKAYLYGFTDDGAVLEYSLDSNSWTPLTGEERELDSGVYRLKYSIKNGSSASSGYVYTNYQSANS